MQRLTVGDGVDAVRRDDAEVPGVPEDGVLGGPARRRWQDLPPSMLPLPPLQGNPQGDSTVLLSLSLLGCHLNTLLSLSVLDSVYIKRFENILQVIGLTMHETITKKYVSSLYVVMIMSRSHLCLIEGFEKSCMSNMNFPCFLILKERLTCLKMIA